MGKRDGLTYSLATDRYEDEQIMTMECPKSILGRSIPLRTGDFLLSPLTNYTRRTVRRDVVEVFGGETLEITGIESVHDGKQVVTVIRGVEGTDPLVWPRGAVFYSQTKEEHDRLRQR